MKNHSNTIVLVMIAEEFNYKILPFPLLFVGTSLKRAGYNVIIKHILPHEILLATEEIVKENPLWVGFSVLTGLPTYRSASMSKMIKNKSSIPIVWGGVHPSLLPEQCIQEEYIDYVVIGEGEETAIEISQALMNKKDILQISGLAFKKNPREIIVNPAKQLLADLDQFGIDFSLINIDHYIIKEIIQYDDKPVKVKSLGYYASRGCPHNCGFCYNLKFNQRSWRAPSADSIIADIMVLKKKYGITKIHFWDDNFFTNFERATKILKAIDVFSGVDIRIDYITPERIKLLKDLKVIFIIIGIETGCNRLLKLINKGFTSEKIMQVGRILGKYPIDTLYGVIMGLPTETRAEFHESIDFYLAMLRVQPKATFTAGLYLPYPGTDLFKLALSEGFKPPNKTEDWNIIDRWRSTVPLPWIDKQKCLHVRHLLYFLTAGIMPIRFWAWFRLKYKIFTPKQDIRALILLSAIFKHITFLKKQSKLRFAVSFTVKGRIYRYTCTKIIFFINWLFGSFVPEKRKLIDRGSIRKILIIHTNMAGDNIVATPMIRNLAKHFKNAKITYLTRKYAAEVLFANPWIKEFILHDSFYDERRKGVQLGWFHLIDKIRKERFDMVIDTEEEISKIERSLLPVFSGARYRIGYNRSKGYRGILHTHEITYKLNMHGAERLLDITRFLSIEIVDKHFEVYFNAGDSTHIRRLLEKYGISEEDFVIGIHAGNTNSGKLWNKEKFAQTADRLIEMFNARIVFTGVPDDKAYLDAIIQRMNHPAVNISGQTTFPQLSALIKRCGLLITLDTVSVHIAAATGTPTVGIYIQTYRSGWLPWNKEKQRFITGYHTCNGCGLGNYLDKITPAGAQTSICKKNFICAEAISVAQVIALAQEVVETHAPGKAYR